VPLTLTDTVLGSARTVRDLALSDAVRDRWHEESACEGMTVGGLAFHLAGQARGLVRLLPEPPDDTEVISTREHYRRAAWANSDLAGDANVEIREGSDDQARAGYDALADRLEADLAVLPAALAGVDDDTPVLIPWQGWSLTARDFAVTRLMEMVVHADDLAASVGVETPAFPEPAVREVLGLLTDVAVDRHGQAALVRALSRPQRAPASVTAF
jgi:uncharacterized protein (TIGR03083 family)